MAIRFLPQFDVQLDDSLRKPASDFVKTEIEAKRIPFAELPYQEEAGLKAIEHMAQRLREKFKAFIVIGIGGSDLGARAVHRALHHQFHNTVSDKKIYFVGDTTDPVPLEEVMGIVHWEDTAIIVISKSGNTIEVMSSFLVLRDRLKKAVGHRYVDHIVAVTDPETGILRQVVNEEGYASLPHLPVGGRFSVLSSVGLFPLALTGLPIRDLLKGAKEMLEEQSDFALDYALLQYAAYKEGKHVHVFMPYTYSLRELGFWFRQLWAESLGKAKNLDGDMVNVGPTPVAALGPTDQHSQVQLYREGPHDKTFTFLTVAKTHDLHVPQDVPSVEGVQFLKGLSFNAILHAEQAGTEEALREVGRPTYTIELDRLDAHHLGGVIMFFELATAYMGSLLNIDPYDQPGVERGKELMHSRLHETS